MQEKYNVTGMTCAACQARVQKSVSKLTGVQECNVNLLKNSMVVTYDDKNVNSGQIIAAVEKAGYGASLQQVKGKSAAQAVSPVDTAKKEYEAMRRRVIWSFVFTIPLFYISMGHMLGWPLPGVFLGTENSMIYALTLFLLVLPVAIINNKYYHMGFKTLFHGSPNMDSLIALGSGASLAYGIYALYKIAWGFGHGDLALVDQFAHDLYFEGAGTILTLITLGKFFEARAKGRTSDAINKLMNLAPKKATVIRDGVESVIPAEEVEKGDILVVKAGESVPVDGVLLEGTGSVDESAITGESIPADKQIGDKVIGATINQSGYFKIRADKVGDETALSQIIRLVDEATSSKAPIMDCIVAMPTQLFYTTQIPVSLWFLAKNKKQKGKTLFIDARKLGTMVTRKLRELTDEDIKKIADTYNAYVDGTLEDEKGFCAVVTTQDIAKQDYILTPGRYVGMAIACVV